MGQGITPAVMKRCNWVEPVLVAQVKFTEWTADDQAITFTKPCGQV
jgi:bifunctional non-homologous end joining protein LigD